MRADIGKQIKNVCTLERDKILWKKRNQKLSQIKRTSGPPNRKNQYKFFNGLYKNGRHTKQTRIFY